MRRLLMLALALSTSLVAASPAQAVVVDMNALGSSATAYNAQDQSGYFGVALVPRANPRDGLAVAGIPVVTSSAPCVDPALSAELVLPSYGVCSHGGSVLHRNETFALVWDPNPHSDYAANYVEQFLRDVASGSDTLGSPYAVTTQYTDSTGRAGNASVYGGGYDDPTAYPTPTACAPSGVHHYTAVGGVYFDTNNDVCLTDADIRSQLQSMVRSNGLAGRLQPGFDPVLVMLTPPGVVTCLDTANKLCSANSDATQVPAQFCSYHSQINVDGKTYAYVVQPWTPQTNCDEPDVPKFPDGAIDPVTLATDMGARLVSPLSQAHIASIVNPHLNGWFALDGSEVNDNGCVPLDHLVDTASVGSGSYFLQHEFNNAGAIVNDPFALPCTPSVGLEPRFVVPSAIDRGDVVDFDGSQTRSTLIVPNANYTWSFGDGTGAVGPSVAHSYPTGGNYVVKLTVVDRGGNVATLSQQIQVLGGSGQAVTPPPVKKPPSTGLSAHLWLIPQGLRSVLAGGVLLRVTSNRPADGIATVSISRRDAQRAHIRTGRARTIQVGRGTVAGIKAGAVKLHLRLSRSMAAKLGHLSHLNLMVRMTLFDVTGAHLSIDAAGTY